MRKAYDTLSDPTERASYNLSLKMISRAAPRSNVNNFTQSSGSRSSNGAGSGLNSPRPAATGEFTGEFYERQNRRLRAWNNSSHRKYLSMTVDKLKEQLDIRGLTKVGRKEDLLHRLLQAVEGEQQPAAGEKLNVPTKPQPQPQPQPLPKANPVYASSHSRPEQPQPKPQPEPQGPAASTPGSNSVKPQSKRDAQTHSQVEEEDVLRRRAWKQAQAKCREEEVLRRRAKEEKENAVKRLRTEHSSENGNETETAPPLTEAEKQWVRSLTDEEWVNLVWA